MMICFAQGAAGALTSRLARSCAGSHEPLSFDKPITMVGMSENDTSKSLLDRLGDHDDQQAWHTFCDVYGPLIYSFSMHRGLQKSDAADVAQEVLLRVAKAMRSFEYDREKGRFRDWLFRITFNEMSRWVSKRKNAANLPVEELKAADGAEWSQQFEQHVLKTALARIRPTVEPETWSLFEKTWLEGQAPGEVAESLGVKPAAVYHAKSRVLKKLKLEILKLAEDSCF